MEAARFNFGSDIRRSASILEAIQPSLGGLSASIFEDLLESKKGYGPMRRNKGMSIEGPVTGKYRVRKMVDGYTLRSRWIYTNKKEAQAAEAEAVQTWIALGRDIFKPLPPPQASAVAWSVIRRAGLHLARNNPALVGLTGVIQGELERLMLADPKQAAKGLNTGALPAQAIDNIIEALHGLQAVLAPEDKGGSHGTKH